MKNFSIEQKAKRYDEAIKRLEDIMTGKCQKTFMFTQGLFDYIFPELKEGENSEYEKIKKALIEMVRDTEGDSIWVNYDVHKKDAIAWIETQYEQKYVDGTFVNVDDIREDFVQEVYRVLDADSTNDRANQIIDAFDNLPTVAIEKKGEHKPTAEEVLIKAGLKPYKDGNQWCVLVGDNIQEGICGFGDTIEDALYNFLKEICKTRQKPTKVEPKYAEIVRTKFKDGDWVIYQNETFQVRSLSNGSRLLQGEKYKTYVIDELCRPWTIQDAKDGDVLSYRKGQWVFIFKKDRKEHEIAYHALISDKGLSVNDVAFTVLEDSIAPATEEQRELLFQKIKEAGYEWDAEKKEVKKLRGGIMYDCNRNLW